MRNVQVPRPFAGGYRTDIPDYALDLNQAAYAQDLVAPSAVAQQRRGWEFRDNAITGTSLLGLGVARNYYAIPDRTTTVFCSRVSTPGTNAWSALSSDGTGAFTRIAALSAPYYPRCVYNGELIMCANDGVSPLIRYAGANVSMADTTVSSATVAMNAGTQVIRFPTSVFPSSSYSLRGYFVTARVPDSSGNPSKNPAQSTKVYKTDNSNTSYTVQSLRNKQTSTSVSGTSSARIAPFGFAYPAVSVLDVGNVTTSGTTATFTGVDFYTDWVITNGTSLGNTDALLVENTTDGSPHEISDISSVNSSTSVMTTASSLSSFTNATFKLLRRCPFKDATVHRGSLVGTGVKQYPSRVYAFGPGDDIGIAPGDVVPADPTRQAGYQSANVTGFVRSTDFLCLAYDVPGPFDSTPVIALLSSPGPLLALKTDAVYGLYGTFDHTNPAAIEVTKITNGSGCIDLRAAVTSGTTPYWAGKEGVFTYRGGVVSNLTDQRVYNEWRSLMRGYVSGTSCVSLGVVGNYLVVACSDLDSTKTSGAMSGPDTTAPTSRTLLYDLKANVWLGRVSNFTPVHMWTVEVEGVESRLYALDNTDSTVKGRVLDFGPAVIDGLNAADGNGVYPRLQAWSGTSLAQADGIEGEARLCDLNITTNIYDTVSPNSVLDVTVVSADGLEDKSGGTKTLTSVTGDSTKIPNRVKRRVNRSGRQHQIRVDMTTTSSGNSKSEIPEFVISFRDTRRGT